MKHNNPRNIRTLQTITKAQGFNYSQAVLLGIHLLKSMEKNTKNPIQQGLKIINEGIKSVQAHNSSVSFAAAVQETLNAKSHRRKRTLEEIRYISSVFIKKIASLGKKYVRRIDSAECSNMINHCFNSPRQRYKARLILHGIFAIAVKRAWCEDNPVDRVDSPALKEKTIKSLNIQQVENLIHTAKKEAKGECLAATAIMLYAGVRPQEVQRLRWKHINLESGFIHIKAMHSKTGGSRHITIHNNLKRILKNITSTSLDSKICPSNWEKKWGRVRKAAGWNAQESPWVQDCLRHSYASFHALYFKNFSRLQYEMGHSNPNLLRTRYLNMDGLDEKSARKFWG